MAGKMFNRYLMTSLVFIFALGLFGAESTLKTIFVEDICRLQNSHILNLKDLNSGILMATSSEEPIDCRIILVPRTGLSVVLSIYRYDLESHDLLTIEDSDHHEISLIGWREFPNEKKSVISDGKMTIRYRKSNNTIFYPKPRFQFTFTQVGKSPCYVNEFECANEKCIPKTLACDGHNHCGDGSDQINCVPKEEATARPELHYAEKNTGSIWIGSIIASSILLLVVIIVFIVAVVRNARKKKASASNQNPEGQVPGSTTFASRDPQPLSVNNLQSPPNITVQASHQPRPNVFNQIRRSLRGHRSQKTEEPSTTQLQNESYQVPSMYPNLDQLPSAPEVEGVHNPTFKPE